MGEGRSERSTLEMWKMNHGGRHWEELQRLLRRNTSGSHRGKIPTMGGETETERKQREEYDRFCVKSQKTNVRLYGGPACKRGR